MKALFAAGLLLVACAPSPEPSPRASAPDPSEALPVIAVKGDWGSGSISQEQVTKAMCSSRASKHFRVVVTTGDNFYDPDGEATHNNYEQPEACLTSDPNHRWRASWGNHDVAGDDTREVLGARRYYHWRLPGVDVMMLDSNRPASPTQRDWLRNTLRSTAGPVKIAVFHHPPYTAGSAHGPDAGVRKYWVPLFEQYGVDLVLSGHAHLFEHHVVDGVDYVVSGGGGRTLHRCARTPTSLRICRSVYHFLTLTMDGSRVVIRAVKRDGTVFHTLRLAA